MKNYTQIIFAQKNPMRFLVSRFPRMTRLCRLLHIQRTGYLLKFHPASLVMALWVDPHDCHLDSETIRALLTEGDSYVDVGANIGHLTIEATLVVGDTPRLLVAMMCPIGALRFWLDRWKTGLD